MAPTSPPLSTTSLLLFALLLPGCAGIIDRGVTRRAVPQLALARDLPLACSFGELGAGAVPVLTGDRSGAALSVSWTISGLCAEIDAWEHGLASQRALVTAPLEHRAALATDARVAANRAHALAARRFQTGYRWTLDQWGDADDCSLRRDHHAGAYMLGLLGGMLALVNDSAAGAPIGVPQNQLLDVARAADCLDDARWWGIPSAMKHAAWAVIPGSGPPDVDPWAELEAAAARGDAVGQGIARALWLFTAANAGDAALVRRILESWPDLATAPEPEWPLLDAYARSLAQHETDLLWLADQGHRAPAPPAPPPLPIDGAAGDDPFGSDPFGGDPFGEEPVDESDPAAPSPLPPAEPSP